ncbi:MAG: polyhydroxybutyrate depolymerase [Myxococcota bacterium]|jgi:polyhydroxybutyrate depolymerase
MQLRFLHLLVVTTLVLTACDDSTPGDTTDTAAATTADDTTVEDTTVEDTTVEDTTVEDTTAAEDTTPAVVDTSPLGGDRPASVYLPVGYDAGESWPLVLLLHGYGASGAIQDGYLQFHQRATTAGFVVAVPEGTKDGTQKNFWNASPAWCCDFGNSGVDDQQYLLDVIAEAKTRFNVDADRVFLFGHSNGGFMSYTMACEHADVIAGIASLAGSGYRLANDCDPSEPVTIMQMHGTADSTIAYAGTTTFPGAVALTDRWTVYNGCGAEPHVSGTVDYDPAALGEETVKTTWTDCDNGSAVALWTMSFSGHIPIVNESFVPDALAFLLANVPTTE